MWRFGLKRGLLATAGLLAVVLQTGTAAPQTGSPVRQGFEAIAPEAATGRSERKVVHSRKHMVAAANPLAAEAGDRILARGGSAVDAAIATALVLNVVEPQSSGIGGGGFMLVWDEARKTLRTFDGRETAPAGVDRNLFKDAAGQRKSFMEAAVGGASVGVPGMLRMFELVHAEFGRLPWPDLFAPAISLAADGFAMSPRLHALLARDRQFATVAEARGILYDDSGAALPVGAKVTNPVLAATLRTVALQGTAQFYSGGIAADIVQAVRTGQNPGAMTLDDLRQYRAVERAPLCIPYRGHRVCTMPPPSSSAAVLQTLGILAQFDMGALRPLEVDAIHLVAQAERLAYADRDQFLADPDFVTMPFPGLLDRSYLAGRARLIDPDRGSAEPAKPGEPPPRHGLLLAPDRRSELPATTHLSVVDAGRNAVAMTVTIENVFGSRRMVRGFLLNNQLTDFSPDAERDGRPVANRIEPGKRPRSSMAPTIVFDGEADLRLVLGSPGGSRIPGYVAKTVIAVLDWGLNVQEAISLPHFLDRNAGLELEKGTPLEAMGDMLRARGHRVTFLEQTSGLHGIEVRSDGLYGGADPRREGVAVGR